MGMRLFQIPIDAVSVAAAQDLFSIKAGSINGLRLHYLNLTAGGVSSPAELRLLVKRLSGTLTAGSGGSSGTAVAPDSADTTSSTATVRVNDTTAATATSSSTLAAWEWNVLGPHEYYPAPEHRMGCKAGEQLVINLPAAPGSSTPISGYAIWEEV
jgi:hypothetical protein